MGYPFHWVFRWMCLRKDKYSLERILMHNSMQHTSNLKIFPLFKTISNERYRFNLPLFAVFTVSSSSSPSSSTSLSARRGSGVSVTSSSKSDKAAELRRSLSLVGCEARRTTRTSRISQNDRVCTSWERSLRFSSLRISASSFENVLTSVGFGGMVVFSAASEQSKLSWVDRYTCILLECFLDRYT